MSSHARVVLATAVLASLAVAPGALGSRAAGSTPPLTLNVNLSGSLEAVLGNGTRIRTTSAPGLLIPPGSYLVLVASDVPDSRDIYHLFHLYGPGVNVESDLLPCENPRPLYAVTLRPSSTYTYEDTRNPQLTPVVFTTSATGSSADTAGASFAAGSTAGTSGTSSNTSVLGSTGPLPFRGALLGRVGPAGTLTLSRNGKSVSSLPAGRYSITVDDTTPTGGFSLADSSRKTVSVTGPVFVGTRRMTVALRPGLWMFFSSPRGLHRFTVVG